MYFICTHRLNKWSMTSMRRIRLEFVFPSYGEQTDSSFSNERQTVASYSPSMPARSLLKFTGTAREFFKLHFAVDDASMALSARKEEGESPWNSICQTRWVLFMSLVDVCQRHYSLCLGIHSHAFIWQSSHDRTQDIYLFLFLSSTHTRVHVIRGQWEGTLW